MTDSHLITITLHEEWWTVGSQFEYCKRLKTGWDGPRYTVKRCTIELCVYYIAVLTGLPF